MASTDSAAETGLIDPGPPARTAEEAMEPFMSPERLQQENRSQVAPGARSEENANLGFTPAFLDFETQVVYPSCYANGRPAPFHLLDGLPEEVVADRAPNGRVICAKATLISGFVRNGFFYTRTAAARAAAEWCS